MLLLIALPSALRVLLFIMQHYPFTLFQTFCLAVAFTFFCFGMSRRHQLKSGSIEETHAAEPVFPPAAIGSWRDEEETLGLNEQQLAAALMPAVNILCDNEFNRGTRVSRCAGVRTGQDMERVAFAHAMARSIKKWRKEGKL